MDITSMEDKRNKPQIPPFEIDSRIDIKIHPELANAVASLILSTDTKNPAILALAHQIKNRTIGSGDLTQLRDHNSD